MGKQAISDNGHKNNRKTIKIQHVYSEMNIRNAACIDQSIIVQPSLEKLLAVGGS